MLLLSHNPPEIRITFAHSHYALGFAIRCCLSWKK